MKKKKKSWYFKCQMWNVSSHKGKSHLTSYFHVTGFFRVWTNMCNNDTTPHMASFLWCLVSVIPHYGTMAFLLQFMHKKQKLYRLLNTKIKSENWWSAKDGFRSPTASGKKLLCSMPTDTVYFARWQQGEHTVAGVGVVLSCCLLILLLWYRL